MSRAAHRGFTLIELLVVIAIMAILAALLFPAVGGVAERSRRSNCRGNVRQIGIAMFQYADSNNGWLVLRGDAPVYTGAGDMSGEYPFRNHVLKLNSNGFITTTAMWICPSDRRDGSSGQNTVSDPKTFGPTYDTRRNCSYMYVAGHNNISTREITTEAPVLADESNEQENGAATPGNMPDIGPDDNHGANYRNVLYLDGHVESIDTANSANAIFDKLKYPNQLQSVD